MVIDACRAGKDVYCEKPLTLTIDEGKLLTKVVKETGRVVQVGSWQRSDDRFRQAVEMVRAGRIGRLQKVDVVLGKNATSGSFVPRTPPAHLNWNLWQGQTPDVPYIEERSHYTFRWWYEYSGGQMTDWGAHHLDIAQWAIDSAPVEIMGTAKMPTVANGYNVAIDFNVTYKYANGVMMTVGDTGDNGILFTGDAGRMFVNRGKITGAPVEALQTNPLNREDWKVYDYDNLERPPRAGKLDAIINHMGNFFDCVETRRTPVSDVESQHRSVSTCHLGNISMRLGRPLEALLAGRQSIIEKGVRTGQSFLPARHRATALGNAARPTPRPAHHRAATSAKPLRSRCGSRRAVRSRRSASRDREVVRRETRRLVQRSLRRLAAIASAHRRAGPSLLERPPCARSSHLVQKLLAMESRVQRYRPEDRRPAAGLQRLLGQRSNNPMKAVTR